MFKGAAELRLMRSLEQQASRCGRCCLHHVSFVFLVSPSTDFAKCTLKPFHPFNKQRGTSL